MYRERLVNFRGQLLTADTAAALEVLLQRLETSGWTPELHRPPPPRDPLLSLLPSGREVHLEVRHSTSQPQACLDALWGHAVPMLFTPWTRYPVAGEPGERVFHFFGPWVYLYDSLLSEGRGHLAWPSICAAAQCDVGTWKGDKMDARFLQAQLHRLGFPCGAVDGVIGPRTTAALAAAGLGNLSSQQAMEHLRTAKSSNAPARARQAGHLALPGQDLVVHATGGLRVTRTPLGASLMVEGPGQLVVTVL